MSQEVQILLLPKNYESEDEYYLYDNTLFTINKILNDNELIDKVIASMNSIEELTNALDITFSPELTTDDVNDEDDDEEEENEPEEDSDDTDFSSTAIFIPTDINNGDDE